MGRPTRWWWTGPAGPAGPLRRRSAPFATPWWAASRATRRTWPPPSMTCASTTGPSAPRRSPCWRAVAQRTAEPVAAGLEARAPAAPTPVEPPVPDAGVVAIAPDLPVVVWGIDLPAFADAPVEPDAAAPVDEAPEVAADLPPPPPAS